MINSNKNNAKPFLKWAGGKTQLLETFEAFYSEQFRDNKIKTYIEAFVGSGALLFSICAKYDFDKIMIWDVNPEVVLVYEAIKYNVNELIEELLELEKKYLVLNKDKRKEFYYDIRSKFNKELVNFNYEEYHIGKVRRASQMLFLNRTCFNGLFRVNKSGEFNVPMGDYKNPKICDVENLLNVNEFLQKVVINLGDYKDCINYVDSDTFVYMDPPYRPLNASSSFTAYSKYDFQDAQQVELSQFFKKLDNLDAYIMLSNSDPKNSDENDNFFDDLYSEFTIERVHAKRMINSKASQRGTVTEILVHNFNN